MRAFLIRLHNKVITKYQNLRFRFLLSWQGDTVLKTLPVSDEWQLRIADVLNCPENSQIPRHPLAGRIVNGVQYMHNGLKIQAESYYGFEIAKMLYENKSVHEPQEEYVFAQVLRSLPSDATILELGSYWGFYSMWFLTERPQATAYLVEPDAANLRKGQANFKLNGLRGHFTNAFISDKSIVTKSVPTFCVDDFLEKNELDFIHILHADIQTYELKMLEGALKSVQNRQIGYVFVSTHSNDLHQKCLDWLKAHDFIIISEVDLDDTFSFDGLIVGRSKYYGGIDPLSISRKTRSVKPL